MSPTTRLRILDYLRKQQTATVQELSNALAMTGANVRHHLAVLESIGVIEFIGQRQIARGRPVNIYTLSRRILGDGLDELAKVMIEIWLRKAPESVREVALRSMALRLAGDHLAVLEVLLPRRLARMVDRMNELHYQARWEAGKDGPRVILGHCPYAAIIDQYPELCQMDAFLLEQWIGQPVEQKAKLQPSVKGYPFCNFRAIGIR